MTAHELAKKLLEGPDVIVGRLNYSDEIVEINHIGDAPVLRFTGIVDDRDTFEVVLGLLVN